MKTPFRNHNYQQEIKRVLDFMANQPSQEGLIVNLKNELIDIKEKDFLTYVMKIFIDIEDRCVSDIFTHLRSPYTAGLYLIDFYYSIPNRTGTISLTMDKWHRITKLIDDQEMLYLVNIGFSDECFASKEHQGKAMITLGSFIEWYYNPDFCYDEQIRNRILINFSPYNQLIIDNFGFSVDDAIAFTMHTNRLMNQKYTKYMLGIALAGLIKMHPKKWHELTSMYTELGIKPEDWKKQPELKDIAKSINMDTSEILCHSIDDLTNVPNINYESVQSLLKFLLYDKEKLEKKTTYYSNSRVISNYPLIQHGKNIYYLTDKFIWEALYKRLHDFLSNHVGIKYKQKCDKNLEKYVLNLFKKIFGNNKTKYFHNYSIDKISEQDILIIYGNACIIVEIKDYKYREPFRDPTKGYTRIKDDFFKAIQYGYKQCRRVEQQLCNQDIVNIYDCDSKEILYQINTNKIEEIYSIVVTNNRYGHIQTNLAEFLQKEDDDDYPWSVCVDDLEIFILLLWKCFKKISAFRFIEFLKHRRNYHGHLICFDELEICGLYLCEREQFKRLATDENIFATDSAMGSIFDAHYAVGLGFQDEINIDVKANNILDDFPKHFHFDTLDLSNS